MGKIFRDSKVLQNESEAAVEIRNDGELKPFLQLLQDVWDFGVKLPYTWFSEVFVGDFEEIVAIKFAQ